MIRVITFYRPCLGDTQDVEASYTTLAQHKRYFDDYNINSRTQFITDIGELIQDFLNKIEKLIVMGDYNDDVRTNHHFKELGLIEAVTTKFLYLPPTYNRSKQFSRPINGLWMSPEIIIKKCGYSAFEEGSPSDHRLVWADIDFSTTFGCPWNKLPRTTPRRLKC